MTDQADDSPVLLLDGELEQQIRERGYGVVTSVIGTEECGRLTTTQRDLLGGADHGGSWWTSGMLEDPVLRRTIFDLVGSVIRTPLTTLTQSDTEIIAGHFHVNPAYGRAGIGPHQDVAIVDERTSYSLNGWIPLTDVTERTGTLRIVPRSHLLGNLDRSLTVPWAFHGLHDLFWDLAEPIELSAGSLVLFDTRAVHCSSANVGPTHRIAVNCILKASGAPMIHLISDDCTPSGHVDVYEVPVGYYVEGDLTTRPTDPRARHVACRPVVSGERDPTAIRQCCTVR